MNEPRRILMDPTRQDFEADVIREALDGGPTPEAKDRMLSGLAAQLGMAPFAATLVTEAAKPPSMPPQSGVHPVPPAPAVATTTATTAATTVATTAATTAARNSAGWGQVVAFSLGGAVLAGALAFGVMWASGATGAATTTEGASPAVATTAASPPDNPTTDGSAAAEGEVTDPTVPDDADIVDADDLPLAGGQPDAPGKPPPARAQMPRAQQAGSAAPPASPTRPSLSEELAAIRIARQRLNSGNARGALAALDDHARRFQRPRLASEATVLRIEALQASGNGAAARRLAAPYLKGTSPYSRRVRAILGER